MVEARARPHQLRFTMSKIDVERIEIVTTGDSPGPASPSQLVIAGRKSWLPKPSLPALAAPSAAAR
jgi:hypothetical protein